MQGPLRQEQEWGNSNMMQYLRKTELIGYGKIGLLMRMGANIMVSGIKILISKMGRESILAQKDVYLRDISKMTNRMEEEEISLILVILSLKENGKMVCRMNLANQPMIMVIYMRVII